jgi:hypothetical protein
MGIIEIIDRNTAEKSLIPIRIKVEDLQKLGINASCEFIGQRIIGMLSNLIDDIDPLFKINEK